MLFNYNPTWVKPAFWWMWLISLWNSIGIIQSFFASTSVPIDFFSSVKGTTTLRLIFIVPCPSILSSLNLPSSNRFCGIAITNKRQTSEAGIPMTQQTLKAISQHLQTAPFVKRIVPRPSRLPATHMPSYT